MNDEPEILTPTEAREIARVSTARLYGWINSGRLPALNTASPGKRPTYRITRHDLLDFLRTEAREQATCRKAIHSKRRSLPDRPTLRAVPIAG